MEMNPWEVLRNPDPALAYNLSKRGELHFPCHDAPKHALLLMRADRYEIKSPASIIVCLQSDRVVTGVEILIDEPVAHAPHLGNWGPAMLDPYAAPLSSS